MILKDQLQRWAIGRFLMEIQDSDEVHIQDRRMADQRLDLLHRLSVFRAGLFGLISGMFVVAIALWFHEWEGSEGWSNYTFFIAVALAGFLSTSLELVFIYGDSLKTAARMAKVLGIPEDELQKFDLEESIPHWLIHAALGAPGFQGAMFGIDPLARIGKLGMLIRKILKKFRIAASATLFKSIVRRMWVQLIGRTALRAFVELVSLPFFVLINAVGMNSMMRDMRSRLVGHELTPSLIEHTFPEGVEHLTPALHSAIYDGIQEQITSARFIHPNQIRILNLIGDPPSHAQPTNSDEQRRASRFLLAMFALSGRLSYRCRRIMRRLESNLGEEEVSLVEAEIEAAIYDLEPFNRPWI
ncbi:MAG: hypothetical protein P8Q40_01130 [Candidatus Poseidonia sp.]|uniref:LBF_2804 family protein n=1 Tax=Poseidonia sp. TaxID=2666344 RepID=UPI0030C05B77|nr:hypothetical protein [Poseidonia sp.]